MKADTFRVIRLSQWHYLTGGIYRIYTNLIMENRRLSTCNRLDLQTRGSRPIMPKNLHDHWVGPLSKSATSIQIPHNSMHST